MKPKTPIALILAWFGLAATPLHPVQAADDGNTATPIQQFATITGQVSNAATGKYIANANVSVRGVNRIVLTDSSGAYRLTGIPVGQATIDISYSGLDPKTVTINVGPDGVVVQDIELTNVARYGPNTGDVQKMAGFVVAENREMEAAAVSINEQRHAANLKTVLSTEAFGDVTENNIGEFLKNMPGVTANYSDAIITTVSVRGIPANYTSVHTDGVPQANASFNLNTREFNMMNTSVNALARIELSKEPLPSDPADTMGGHINLVSKDVFDYRVPEFSYRVGMSLNNQPFTIRKTGFTHETYTHKGLPGFDLSWAYPISKNFGFIITASTSNQYNPQDIITNAWSGTVAGATPSNPYLQSVTVTDAPKSFSRNNLGVKLDWRTTPHSVLSFRVDANYMMDVNGNYNVTYSAGTSNVSTVANGVNLSYSPTQTTGATGRGSITQGAGMHHFFGPAVGEMLRYRYDDGIWRVVVGANHSDAGSQFRYAEFGTFTRLITTLAVPARISFTGIQNKYPLGIQAFDNNNAPIDINNINNYIVTGATNGYRDNHTAISGGDFSVRRQITSSKLPLTIEFGGSLQEESRHSTVPSYTYTYNGINGSQAAAPFAAKIYKTKDDFGYKNIPWASPKIAYTEWRKNPSLFTFTPAQLVANELSYITTLAKIKETTAAGYLQGDVRSANNRWKLVGGVRYQQAIDNGAGPSYNATNVFQRNANGSFALDSTGKRIRLPEAGAVGSIEELRMTRKALGERTHTLSTGFYPSLHLTYSLTERLQVRAEWARTFGKPDFGVITPATTYTESSFTPEDGVSRGTISVSNPYIKPWTANNFDLELEYYTKEGGVFSAGVFTKQIENFFGRSSVIATPALLESLDIDGSYVGWTVNTNFNAGSARIDGAEFNIMQSLRPLGGWGEHVQMFFNGTLQHLKGNQSSNFSGFLDRIFNWGFTVTRNPVTFMAKWQSRGSDRRGAVTAVAPDAFLYSAPFTMLDLNVDYQLNRRLSLFTNVRNVFNAVRRDDVYGAETPDYAKQRVFRNYGVQFNIGVKGKY